MKRVFVSYSRNNLEIVSKLIHDLEAAGIDVWYDQTLTGGQLWWDNILENIRDREVFLFTLSPESWESSACRSELNYVQKLGKQIIPVLISEEINLNLLSAPLNQIQVIDFRKGEKESIFALVKSIYANQEIRPLPDPLPIAPPVPVSYLSTLKEKIDSTEPMNSDFQIKLLFELEEELRNGRSPSEVRELLLAMKRREDLLAKIAIKIDEALRDLQVALSNNSNQESQKFNANSKELILKCPKCGSKVEEDEKFCSTCGASLMELKKSSPPEYNIPLYNNDIPIIDGSKIRRFSCSPSETLNLVSSVRIWLDTQGFDLQQKEIEKGDVLLQIKKRGGWRDYVGMATSLNIMFHQRDNKLTIQIGAGKWMDKAAAGTVSLFVLWPLAITAGLGAWEQMNMPEKIFDYINTKVNLG